MVRKAKKPIPPSADHGPPENEKWKDRRPFFNGWNIYTPEDNAYQIDHNCPKKYKIYPDRNKHWFCFYNYYRYSCPFYHDAYREGRNERPFAYHALAKQNVRDWLRTHPDDVMAIEHVRKMDRLVKDGVLVVNSSGEVIEYRPNSMKESVLEKTQPDPVMDKIESLKQIITKPTLKFDEVSNKLIIAENKIHSNSISDNDFIKMLQSQLDASRKQLEKMTLERKEITDTLMNLIKKLIG